LSRLCISSIPGIAKKEKSRPRLAVSGNACFPATGIVAKAFETYAVLRSIIYLEVVPG
jgi:hypothetical protein